jgi:AcrR family transcriptional regulator
MSKAKEGRFILMGIKKNGHLTKQKIISCALDLFATKGYTETGVREIAANVGIKSASFFYHFETKSAIGSFTATK